jgi:hypothetical protein
MKQTICAPKVPTANLTVNKSRIKLYDKQGEMPTYYLQSEQEFQIELFNPTTDVILAKIQLNNKHISQGGLVLNPGQRVFLERYLDVAKKFKFDTYEVSNTQEVKEAIQKNGDFKVDFYKEEITYPTYRPIIMSGSWGGPIHTYRSGTYTSPTTNTFTTLGLANTNATGISNTSFNAGSSTTNIGGSSSAYYSDASTTLTSSACMDSLSIPNEIIFSHRSEPIEKSIREPRMRSAKTIETGRVEQGANSNQEIERVSKNFSPWAFHSIEYKLLPISQKVNTTDDINVKLYCTNCGAKLGKGHKFCSSCGTKA